MMVVVDGCTSCREAEALWAELAAEMIFDFSVVEKNELPAADLIKKLKLSTFPALFIDGELRAIGVQDREQALALIADRESRT